MAPGPHLPFDSPMGKDIQSILHEYLKKCRFKLDFNENTKGLDIKLIHNIDGIMGPDEEVLIQETVYLDHSHGENE